MFLKRGSFLKCVRRSQPVFLQVDPHAFLGFAVFLLMIFMTAPQPHSGRWIDLPVATNGKSIRKISRYDSIIISITRDGSVYFRNAKVSSEELPNRIHDAVLNGAEKRVYLKTDARARYGDVSSLLPYIQLSGVHDVTFPVETPISPER
jgi:biopolymer transport protein ExbD